MSTVKKKFEEKGNIVFQNTNSKDYLIYPIEESVKIVTKNHFRINDDEEVLFIRDTSPKNKRNQGTVITEQGIYCISNNKKYEMPWYDIEKVKYRDSKILFECRQDRKYEFDIDNFLKKGLAEKSIETIKDTYKHYREILKNFLKKERISITAHAIKLVSEDDKGIRHRIAIAEFFTEVSVAVHKAEKEYSQYVKKRLENDGKITDSERVELEGHRTHLGISKERAEVLEEEVKRKYKDNKPIELVAVTTHQEPGKWKKIKTFCEKYKLVPIVKVLAPFITILAGIGTAFKQIQVWLSTILDYLK